MTSIRLATASPATQPTTAATLALVADLARRASSQGVDLLLLPEALVGGYPRGTAFGCVIGDRTAEGREEFARYFEQAVDLGDTVGEGAGAGQRWVRRELGEGEGDVRGDGTRETLETAARESGVFIVVGCIERAGGSLYCAVVYVCPKEGIIGKRRKVMPTGTERLIWAQGSPSTLRAVTTTLRGVRVNLAAAICWENYMPLLRQSLYAQNVNLYLAPTADGRDSWLGLMRTVGIEGRCFVVSSNMCVRGGSGGGGGGTNGETARMDVDRGRESQVLSHRRRNSAMTVDGHEIALPKSSPRRKRRQSVIDENGNEIVLCRDEENCEDDTAPPPPPKETALPKSPTRRKRRQSVIDENGNEIVLCRDGEDCEDSTIPPQPPKSNGASPKTTFTTPFTTTAEETYLTRGGSCIVSPFGDVLAGPQWEDDEGIVYADVDFRECIRGRLDLDAAGSYSRNDAFKFSVAGLDLDPLPY